jgi:hypothetical protein
MKETSRAGEGEEGTQADRGDRELDPALLPYLDYDGEHSTLRHPLLVQAYDPAYNWLFNETYERKRKSLAEARCAQDWKQ